MNLNFTRYELNEQGRLEAIDTTQNTNLEPGTWIKWGGNYGWEPTRYCIISRIESKYGVSYQCYNLDEPENNASLHHVDSYSIKDPRDSTVKHGQYYFLEEGKSSPDDIELYKAHHLELAKAKKEREDQQTAELDRLEAIGRELWPRLIGDCVAVIVAEHEKNTSDMMTDYFASVTTQRVILAPSKHKRDLFPEMRKAADLLPETQHLGVGKGLFTPYVEIGQDFTDNGRCFYKGSRSHWHDKLDKTEDYNSVEFYTREEAEAFIASKGDPHPITFEGVTVPFVWNIAEKDIENREKYSMGHGYYLGHHRYSGWQVSKEVFYHGSPQREHYIDLARRHDHLSEPNQTDPAPKSPRPVAPAGYRIEYDRDWTWLYFDAKPTEEIRTAMKVQGGRFSGRRIGWYFTQHLDESAIAALIGSDVPQVEQPIVPKSAPALKADPIPAKFRDLADKLTDKIEDMRRPLTQNSTPKRERERMSRLIDADHLERTQKALYAIADAREAGSLPPELEGLKSKSAIHDLLYTHWTSAGYYDIRDTGEFTDKTPEGLALQALIGGDSEEAKARRELEQAEAKARNLVGQIDGFFPTPRAIVERMLDLAGVEAGMEVLEPEAGSGAMAEVIRERGAHVDTIEINYTLCEILRTKGFDAQQDDFLELIPGKLYDAVIMNPPFEKRQDIQHVKHAFEFLKDGGRLVSVMSEGTFFRSDNQTLEFCEWLSEVGYDIPLDDGAFKESGTNVKTRLVVIDK